MADRLLGTLARWNADRGFGFITLDAGRADVFVHASDLSRIGGAPEPSLRLDFQVRPGKDGRMRAFDVWREGMRIKGDSDIGHSAKPVARAPDRPRPSPRRSRRSPALTIAVVAILGAGAYFIQDSPSAPMVPHEPATLLAKPAADESSRTFTCDGRTRCPEMNSCEEATYFIEHCPNTQMDGDGDGVPCEEEHC